MAKVGRRFVFHGSFSSKADARAKEHDVGGFIRPTMIRGHRRFMVLTRKGHHSSNPGRHRHSPGNPHHKGWRHAWLLLAGVAALAIYLGGGALFRPSPAVQLDPTAGPR